MSEALTPGTGDGKTGKADRVLALRERIFRRRTADNKQTLRYKKCFLKNYNWLHFNK